MNQQEQIEALRHKLRKNEERRVWMNGHPWHRYSQKEMLKLISEAADLQQQLYELAGGGEP